MVSRMEKIVPSVTFFGIVSAASFAGCSMGAFEAAKVAEEKVTRMHKVFLSAEGTKTRVKTTKALVGRPHLAQGTHLARRCGMLAPKAMTLYYFVQIKFVT